MKPFKGIIGNWRLDEGCIAGTCLMHTTYENSIVQGLPMRTSRVITIYTHNGLTVAETKNSLYVLMA